MAQDLNTNDLYNMIAQNKVEADKVATLAKGTPTFEANMQSGLVGQDKTLASATTNYSDSVAQLFAHDKAMAASNTTPSFAPEGYVSNPMTAESTSANLFAQKGERVAQTLKDMETRRNILGDAVAQAVSAYKYAVESKQISVDAGAKSIDQLSKLLSDEETKRKNKAQEALDAMKISSAGGESELGQYAQMMIDGVGDIKDVPIKYRGAVNAMLKDMDAQDQLGLYRLPAKEKIGAGNLLNIYKEATSARDALGTTKPSMLTGWLNPKTGPLMAKFGAQGPNGELRVQIDDLTADKVNARYGGALTPAELERMTKWAPDSKEQEQSNWVKLNRMAEAAKEVFRNKLIAAGYTEAEANEKTDGMFKTASTDVPDSEFQGGF